ncbi:MAG: hypothetical protein NZ611_08520, partial [Bacteroidia bacterium]|nr:hypothetical protein [Bacteroidia bacterium]
MRAPLLLLGLAVWVYAQDACGDNRIWYVVPQGGCAGGAGCGSKTNPATLDYALSQACGQASAPGFNPGNDPNVFIVLRLASGDYVRNTTLDICSNHIVIEGGYDRTTWRKSNGATTRIRRTNANPEGANLNAPEVPRLVGIRAVGRTNFRLQDLVVEVQGYDPNSVHPNSRHGISVYGIYLNNCSNYRIVRCDVTAGAGSRGADGTRGNDGGGGTPGSGGGNGQMNPGLPPFPCFGGT